MHMEDHLGQPTAIEFFGCPGSGKTTIAQALAKELRSEGYRVQDTISLVNNRYGPLRRMVFKAWATCVVLIRHRERLFNLYKGGRNRFASNVDAVKQFVNVCFVTKCMYDAAGYDFIIADQGLLQAAVSIISSCEQIEEKSTIDALLGFQHLKAHYIHVIAEEKAIMLRLGSRAGRQSRVEKVSSEDERRNALRTIRDVCCRVQTHVDTIETRNDASSSLENVVGNLRNIVLTESSLPTLPDCGAPLRQEDS